MEIANFNTFVFLDLETTGLPQYESNKTKITELCMVAVQSQHLLLGTIPRVQNKLSLCFNPRKLVSADSEEITGLSNYLLEHLQWFSSKTVDSMNLFFDHLPKPICLVAHNGNYFDFPILKAEIQKTGTQLLEDIYCVDSLDIFRHLYWSENDDTVDAVDSAETVKDDNDALKQALKIQKINETTPKKGACEIQPNKKARSGNVSRILPFSPSFKLQDVYRRVTNTEPTYAHQAEGDTMMLLSCAISFGSKFTDQAKVTSRKFTDIPAMTPGTKIGTKR